MSCGSCYTSLIGFLFFNDPATTDIYPLPLRDALPISPGATDGDRIMKRFIIKTAAIWGVAALACAASAQVATQANSGYQTEEQRKAVAQTLANPEQIRRAHVELPSTSNLRRPRALAPT